MTHSCDFRVDIIGAADSVVLVTLHGELDLSSLSDFEATIETLNSMSHDQVVIDLRQAHFISVDGYAIIGQLAPRHRELTIYAEGTMTSQVLGLLGCGQYRNITIRESQRWPHPTDTEPHRVRPHTVRETQRRTIELQSAAEYSLSTDAGAPEDRRNTG